MSGCPTPRKMGYHTSDAARFFAGAENQRPYRCPCGKWHLTSKAKHGGLWGFARRRS